MIDITENFFGYTTSKPSKSDSIFNKSAFLDICSSLSFELTSIGNRLKELQTLIQKYGRLNKQQSTINKVFMNLREAFKEVDLRIKKLALLQADIKGSKSIRQKFKDSMLIILETRFIELTIRYKKDYEMKIELQTQLANKKGGSELVAPKNKFLDKSLFLEDDQELLIEQTSRKEYQEIEKSIVQISEMYKHMASVVKLHSMTIDTIDDNTKDALGNVTQGRRNMSEIQKREAANRKFIIRVFVIAYVFVFIYIVFLL